jgi:hypothetical protein
MFLSLSKIIKWLIIFLIIEVLLLSIGSYFKKNQIPKETLLHYTFTLQPSSFASIPTLEENKSVIQVESKTIIPTIVYRVKKIENSFRMVSLKTEEDVLSIKNQQVEPICYTNTIDLGYPNKINHKYYKVKQGTETDHFSKPTRRTIFVSTSSNSNLLSLTPVQ